MPTDSVASDKNLGTTGATHSVGDKWFSNRTKEEQRNDMAP
jgi:hypothetical protein